jgi:O-antigen ligase
VAYLTALIGIIGIALTNHRSGYVALFLTIPPLLINSRRMARRAILGAVVILTAALLLLAVSPATRESVLYSFDTLVNPTADTSARDRVDRSKLGWDYFVAHPLGDYQWNQSYYLVYVGPDNFEPHNFVIQLLGQQGIVGFAFFAGLVVATARIGWRNRRDRVSAVMLAYLAFYLIFCLFNTNLLSLDNVMLLIVAAGVILAQNAALQGSLEFTESARAAAPADRLLRPGDSVS